MTESNSLADDCFVDDWQLAKLADIATKIQDGTHFSPQSTSGPYRYLTSKNVRFGRMDITDSGWISEQEHLGIFSRCDVRFGDVLLTKDGANTGNAALNILTEQFSLLSSVAVIRTDDVSAHSPFILQYILSPQGQQRLKDLMAGNAITRLTLEKIRGFIVPLPPVNHQRKIARILTTLDNLIEKTESLIAKYQAVKQGMIHDLFTRGVDAHGKLRPPQSDAPDLYKQSELGWIPKEWDVRYCGSLCSEIVVGIVIRPVQYYRPSGVPVLRSANVRVNKIIGNDLVYMSEGDNKILAKSQLRQGDVATVRTGVGLGTTAAIPAEFDGCNCIDVVISRPFRDKLRSAFLSFWVNSEQGYTQVCEGMGGLAQQHFNVGEMRAMLVKIPDIKEQERIEKVLNAQSHEIETLDAQLTKSRLLKSGLMQDLLTGKVRVNIDEEESADV